MPHPRWNDVVKEIFGSQEIPEVNEDTLQTFRDHLRNTLEHPCYLFSAHHDGVHTEAVRLICCADQVDVHEGLYVQVRRTSDAKELTIPLAQLECPAEDRENHVLLDTYCTWFIRSAFRSLWDK